MTATSPAASPTTSLTARQSQPTSPAARQPTHQPTSQASSLSLLAAPYWDAFAALEAAPDARVVTGDDGLDHYL